MSKTDIQNQREPLVSAVSSISLDENRVINKVYVDENNKFYQQVFLVSFESWNGLSRHQVTALGRKGSFCLSVYDFSEVALYAYEHIIKTGELIACDCGNNEIYKINDTTFSSGRTGGKVMTITEPLCKDCYEMVSK